ncbi:hypothetical protein, variant 2 [Aphanomyces invadans]|uniref:Uncharacterized protein n=1 Tax=Aphanomyces invadans TaxID=157072 RepID=A0A024U9W5_9STRA|nr:hypothetical protein, variant 1 [Aphanomyces invadans]XP_008868374.1 hypothetical protein, variant 2 [Aphanomyces invadans]ETW02989.1 hypothetical protein, variant 1 [Aphanomyces invadans]ETW02990.1 hypothetical protein, variant 2 [Aphanomyces invadans]|eukprot:XP_008868373.1 hypothetical protein, variant 1 [Aphanomyces invadans]
MFACSYATDAIWVVAAVVCSVRGGDAALGFLTSSSIAFMITWYSLRTYDRHAFTALVHAEWGMWSSSALLGVVSRIVDAIIHVLIPVVMLSSHLGRIKLWMSPVGMLVAVAMHRLRRLPTLPFHRFAFYQFLPRRSPRFWDAAFALDILVHGSLPLFCHVAVQQPALLYGSTLFVGGGVVGLQLLRSILLPKVRGAAADIMRRLLAQGGIHAHAAILAGDPPSEALAITTALAPIHILVHDGNFWLDWMSDGLVAIGESYVSGQWSLHPSSTASSPVQLDTLIFRLLTLPVEARREMYQSWPARWVSLATRVCQYPSSAACHVIDRVKEGPCDNDPAFRATFLGAYTYIGCGLWADHAAAATSATDNALDTAQERAMQTIAQKLALAHGHLVLDLNLGSGGGVGCYFAAQFQVDVISIVLSRHEQVAAMHLAQQHNIGSRVQFILVDDVQSVR